MTVPRKPHMGSGLMRPGALQPAPMTSALLTETTVSYDARMQIGTADGCITFAGLQASPVTVGRMGTGNLQY